MIHSGLSHSTEICANKSHSKVSAGVTNDSHGRTFGSQKAVSATAAAIRGRSIYQQADGGIDSYSVKEGERISGEYVFFVGVIDILIPFGTRKKAEYAYKHVQHAGNDNFSVIPPHEYAQRFSEFVCSAIT